MIASTPRPARIPRTCRACGAGFSVPPCAVRQGRGIYCSMACARPTWLAALWDGAEARSSRAADRAAASCPKVPDAPAIRVPGGAVRLRIVGACPHCGGTAFGLDAPPTTVERPHPSERGTVVCLLCSRKVATLVAGGGA